LNAHQKKRRLSGRSAGRKGAEQNQDEGNSITSSISNTAFIPAALSL
jgi:hypothetical protein